MHIDNLRSARQTPVGIHMKIKETTIQLGIKIETA